MRIISNNSVQTNRDIFDNYREHSIQKFEIKQPLNKYPFVAPGAQKSYRVIHPCSSWAKSKKSNYPTHPVTLSTMYSSLTYVKESQGVHVDSRFSSSHYIHLSWTGLESSQWKSSYIMGDTCHIYKIDWLNDISYWNSNMSHAMYTLIIIFIWFVCVMILYILWATLTFGNCVDTSNHIVCGTCLAQVPNFSFL